jgi:NitT/TauT family transport system substrate-binding protein
MAQRPIRIAGMSRREFIAHTAQVAAALTIPSSLGAAIAAETARKLKVGSIQIVNFAAIYRFRTTAKDFGIDVELVNFPSGTERLNALAAGYIDAAPTGSSQPIILRSKGVPIRIVADVVRKGKGLMVGSNIQTFNDLRGKDIGTVRGSTTDIWLRQKLIDEGLSPDRDVNLVNMDYLQMATAVLAGRVPAASGAEPQIAAFEVKGGRVLSYLTDTKLGDIDAVLCFLETFIKKDRALAKAVVAALAQASRDLQRDPNLVVEMMADALKMDHEIIRRSLKNLTFSVKPDPAAIANLAAALKEMNLIDRLPSADEYLDMSLVNEI